MILFDMLIRWGPFLTLGYAVFRVSRRGSGPHPVDPAFKEGWLRTKREVLTWTAWIFAVCTPLTFLQQYENRESMISARGIGQLACLYGIVGYWATLRCIWVTNPRLARNLNLLVVGMVVVRGAYTRHQMNVDSANQQAAWNQQQQNEWLANQIAASQAQAVQQAMQNYPNSH